VETETLVAPHDGMMLVAEPVLGEEEKAALAAVIDSGWITMGERVRAFERAFAAEHGAADAVAVTSCTAGLHLILEAFGIGRGDEVLVPSLTFVATVNSVLYAGARPVLVDIRSLDEPIISLADAARKTTARTKAVVLMHYAGYLPEAEEWRLFARTQGLLLIEDSAHAIGAARGPVFGDAAAFSFVGNKNMTTAEGGMVLARDEAVLARIRQMRSHGMTAGTVERLSGRVFTYDVTMLGYNYRMDDLRAAIGLTQLRHLDEWNDRRSALSRTYRMALASECPEVMVPFRDDGTTAHHILATVLPPGTDRGRVMERMREAGVQTTIHYPPVHQLSWYRREFPCARLPQTEEYGLRELTLPLHPRMDDTQVEAVVHALKKALDRAS
jgi:dTDP-4-amino-4,6-dideoxygalactose transaminase